VGVFATAMALEVDVWLCPHPSRMMRALGLEVVMVSVIGKWQDILAVYLQFIHAMAYNAAGLVVLMATQNLLIVGNNKAYGTLPRICNQSLGNGRGLGANTIGVIDHRTPQSCSLSIATTSHCDGEW